VFVVKARAARAHSVTLARIRNFSLTGIRHLTHVYRLTHVTDAYGMVVVE